jgi:hypothetical protein
MARRAKKKSIIRARPSRAAGGGTEGKEAPREPVSWEISAALAGRGGGIGKDEHGVGGTDLDQYRPMKISGEPLPAMAWLEKAVARLKASPDCPERVTDAARRLENEMDGAFGRRECDAAWKWGSIKNTLTLLGYWPRMRPSRR